MAGLADIPEGAIGVVVALITQGVLFVWNASAAAARLKQHEERAKEQWSRIDKLEARVDNHEDKLDRILSELRDKLARIETAVSFLTTASQQTMQTQQALQNQLTAQVHNRRVGDGAH